jgi:tRNA-intron endonuclease
LITTLVDDKVYAKIQAINELYNTGYYGKPIEKKSKLELTLIEAAYLLYRNKIDIELDNKQLSFKEFFIIASTRMKYFELKYIVYRDLRERGFFVQPSVTGFRLYPRGSHPGKGAANRFIEVHTERIGLPLKSLLKSIIVAKNVRKEMILAIVDEESDITYYDAKMARLKEGGRKFPNINANASLLEDRVIVWDSELKDALHEYFYGKPLDEERLQLSLIESGYLLEQGVINIQSDNGDKKMDFNEFAKKSSEIEPEFFRKYAVYKDLRNKGCVPKTGFKFGTHFRVYGQIDSVSQIPHSEYLIHAIPSDFIFALPVMSRAIRLAGSVRKRMIFAIPLDEKIEYIDIGRIKM